MREETAFEKFIGETGAALCLIRATIDRKEQLDYISYLESLCETGEYKDSPIRDLIKTLCYAIEDCIDLNNPCHKIAPDNDIKRICNNAIRLIERASVINIEINELPKITDYSIGELNKIISRMYYLYKAIVEQPSLYYKRKSISLYLVSIFDFGSNKYIRESIVGYLNSLYYSDFETYDMMIINKAEEFCNIIDKYCSGNYEHTEFTEKNEKAKFLNAKECLEMLPYKLKTVICKVNEAREIGITEKACDLYNDRLNKQIIEIESKRIELYKKYNLEPAQDSYAAESWGTL